MPIEQVLEEMAELSERARVEEVTTEEIHAHLARWFNGLGGEAE